MTINDNQWYLMIINFCGTSDTSDKSDKSNTANSSDANMTSASWDQTLELFEHSPIQQDL